MHLHGAESRLDDRGKKWSGIRCAERTKGPTAELGGDALTPEPMFAVNWIYHCFSVRAKISWCTI
jgi:hypothetical protein